MNEILTLFGEIKREVQGLSKALAKFSKTHSQRLTEEWIRTDTAIKILGISNRTLSRLTNSGKLAHSKVNGIIYIKTTDLENLFNDNYKQAA